MQVLKFLRLSITINFTKMKEDNIGQLGDYDVPFCDQQYTHGYYCISLFKFKSFDQFNTPQTASKFRHLLSCGKVCMVHSLSSGKGKMFLCAACHAFTPHVNAWKNLIGIVIQIQARGFKHCMEISHNHGNGYPD